MDIQAIGFIFSNDLRLVGKLIHKTLRGFLPEEGHDKLKTQDYFSFSGIEESVLSEFYGHCNIKNVFSKKIDATETFILLSVIAPHYFPDTFRVAKYLFSLEKDTFASIGGKILGDNKCFYPTSETLMLLLAGHNLEKRIELSKYFLPDSKLFVLNLIERGSIENGASQFSCQLIPQPELFAVLKGEDYKPEYSSNFPATRIETRMDWEDLVLPYETYESLEELKMWMDYGNLLVEHKEIGKRVKPGYRCLFYGPPGTGKTLTASLIGKTFGYPVYRIDLSMVVSKWVGETEKNLRGIFDQATNKKWILFFDEADSLFGKRTNTNSSNDRYANQEVSYLLQRIEEFPGLVILASNLKSNIDDAFNRRFQSSILFPMPDSEIRFILWKKAFPADFPLEDGVDLNKIAQKYELAGGAIINIVRYCVLRALKRNEGNIILFDDIEHAIIREFKKEGKIVS